MAAQQTPSSAGEIRRYVDRSVDQIFGGVKDYELPVTLVPVTVRKHGEALVAAKLFGTPADGTLVVSGIAKHLWSGLLLGERHQIRFDGVKRAHEHAIQRCTRFAVQGEIETVPMDAEESLRWPNQLQGDDALNESALLMAELLNFPTTHDLLKSHSTAMPRLNSAVDLLGTELFVDDAIYFAIMRNSGHWPSENS